MKLSKSLKLTKNLLILSVIAVFSVFLAACNENSAEDNQTDDEFLT